MSPVPRLARPLLNAASSVTGRRLASARGPYKGPTMDMLPSPEGSFAEAQKKRDLEYNLTLLLGIAGLAGTIAYMYYDESQFFNWAPPDLPEEQFGKRPKRPWLGLFKD